MRPSLRLLPLLTMIFFVLGCGDPKPDAVAEDLTRLCTAMTELEGRQFADGFERSSAMQTALTSAIHESATRDFMGSLATRGPEERMGALQAFAAEHGLPNYQCPALQH